jgi:hypothetical protein
VVGIHPSVLSLARFTYSCVFSDGPEIAPGGLIGNPSAVTNPASSTAGNGGAHGSGGPTQYPATSSSSSFVAPTQIVGGSSNTGAIVGGVVGGIAAISIVAAAIFFYLRRRHSSAPPAPYESQPAMDEIQQPLSRELASPPISVESPGTPQNPMRIYVRVFRVFVAVACVLILDSFLGYAQNPNDPTTFPGYQEAPPVPVSPVSTNLPIYSPYTDGTGTGNNLATMQITRPQAHGYHGLPTV